MTGGDTLPGILKREHLESRFGAPVVLEKLTDEQIAEYRMSPAERAAAQTARDARDQRLNEWREARDINLATTRTLASPPTAVFKPKNPDKN